MRERDVIAVNGNGLEYVICKRCYNLHDGTAEASIYRSVTKDLNSSGNLTLDIGKSCTGLGLRRVAYR